MSPKKKVAKKDQPLKLDVSGGVLTISIGVKTLAYCAEHMPDYDMGVRVNDPARFAAEVVGAFNDEDESGASIISNAIDAAFRRALDDGSTAADIVEP